VKETECPPDEEGHSAQKGSEGKGGLHCHVREGAAPRKGNSTACHKESTLDWVFKGMQAQRTGCRVYLVPEFLALHHVEAAVLAAAHEGNHLHGEVLVRRRAWAPGLCTCDWMRNAWTDHAKTRPTWLNQYGSTLERGRTGSLQYAQAYLWIYLRSRGEQSYGQKYASFRIGRTLASVHDILKWSGEIGVPEVYL